MVRLAVHRPRTELACAKESDRAATPFCIGASGSGNPRIPALPCVPLFCVCVISFQLIMQLCGLANAESVRTPFKGGQKKTSQSLSQLALGSLPLERAECRSALTKPPFSQSQKK